MCDPVTAIAMAATSVASDLPQLMEENNRIKRTNYEIDEAMRKANLAIEEAGIERQEGIEEARNKRLKSILAMGDTKTHIASGNLGLLSQTSSNILDSEKLAGDIEVMNTLKSSERRSNSYLQKADEYYRNAELMSMTSKQNKRILGLNMTINAVKSAISTAGGSSSGMEKAAGGKI